MLVWLYGGTRWRLVVIGRPQCGSTGFSGPKKTRQRYLPQPRIAQR